MPGIDDLFAAAAKEIVKAEPPKAVVPPVEGTPVPPVEPAKPLLPEELRSIVGEDIPSFVNRHKQLTELEVKAKEKEEALTKSLQEKEERIKILDIRSSDEYREQAQLPLDRARKTLVTLVGSEAKAAEMAKALGDKTMTDEQKGAKIRSLMAETGIEGLSYSEVTKAIYNFWDANGQHEKFLQNWDSLKKEQKEKAVASEIARSRQQQVEFHESKNVVKLKVLGEAKGILADFGIAEESVSKSADHWDSEISKINTNETPDIVLGAKHAVLGKAFLDNIDFFKEILAKAKRLDEISKGKPGNGTSGVQQGGNVDGGKLGLAGLGL